MKKNLIVKIFLSMAFIALILLGIFVYTGRAKADTSAVDMEKSFLQTFSQNGIKQYQKVNLTEGYAFIDGQGNYNVVCESNGTWILISKLQLPVPTATPTP